MRAYKLQLPGYGLILIGQKKKLFLPQLMMERQRHRIMVVITVGPAGKAPFVYCCMQTRPMGQ